MGLDEPLVQNNLSAGERVDDENQVTKEPEMGNSIPDKQRKDSTDNMSNFEEETKKETQLESTQAPSSL